jgi:hypothetical protein
MRGAVLYGQRDVRCEERAVPTTAMTTQRRLAHPPAGPDPDRDRGRGWARREGGPVEEIRPGDAAWFPLGEPGEDHWHGAAPTRFMTHLALQEVDDQGSAVTWGEHVTDEEYGAAPALDA